MTAPSYDMYVRLDGHPRPISELSLEELRRALQQAHEALFHCQTFAAVVEVGLDLGRLPQRTRYALEKVGVAIENVYVPRDEEEELRKPREEGTTTIEIYPETPQPDWLKIGAHVHCRGEAQDVFTIGDIDPKTCSSMLVTASGTAHGRESWSKLTLAAV